MYHTTDSIKAAKIYRRHASSVKQYHDSATPVQDRAQNRKVEEESLEDQEEEEDSDASSDAASNVPELAEVRRALCAEYDKCENCTARTTLYFFIVTLSPAKY
jgi:hypothetical protein